MHTSEQINSQLLGWKHFCKTVKFRYRASLKVATLSVLKVEKHKGTFALSVGKSLSWWECLGVTSVCGQREREAFEVTAVCFVALSGIDVPGGAAHFAAVSATTGLEDPCAGGKSPRSVLTNYLFMLMSMLTAHTSHCPAVATCD